MSAALSGFENASGSPEGDTLVGDAGTNVLDGGLGGDVIDGGAGPDTLLGGDGDDRLFARDGSGDTVDCGTGTGDSAVTDRLSLDTVTGCESVDALAEPSVVSPVGTPPATAKKKCKKTKHRRGGAHAKKKCKKKRKRRRS
jgi:hypothetical protein